MQTISNDTYISDLKLPTRVKVRNDRDDDNTVLSLQ